VLVCFMSEQAARHIYWGYKIALEQTLTTKVGIELSLICEFFKEKHSSSDTIFIAGNGGSASLAGHMAVDLYKQGGLKGKVIPLTDLAITTAIGNDIGYEQVFAHPLETMGSKGDILVVISASGNSPNILGALQVAKDKSMRTIGFLGTAGESVCKARALCDLAIVVESAEYGICEDCHVICMHMLVEYIKTLNDTPSTFA
jgi:D-sedoheptulose 7-phosphate isomerase